MRPTWGKWALTAAAVGLSGCGSGAKYHCLVLCPGQGAQFTPTQVNLEGVTGDPCAAPQIPEACGNQSTTYPNCTCSPG